MNGTTSTASTTGRKAHARHGVAALLAATVLVLAAVGREPTTVLETASNGTGTGDVTAQVTLDGVMHAAELPDRVRVGLGVGAWWWDAAAAVAADREDMPFTATADLWVVLSVTAASELAAREQLADLPGVTELSSATVTRDGRPWQTAVLQFDTPDGEVRMIEHRAITDTGHIVTLVAGCARGCMADADNDLTTGAAERLTWRNR